MSISTKDYHLQHGWIETAYFSAFSLFSFRPCACGFNESVKMSPMGDTLSPMGVRVQCKRTESREKAESLARARVASTGYLLRFYSDRTVSPVRVWLQRVSQNVAHGRHFVAHGR
jgi:hypothetical protein